MIEFEWNTLQSVVRETDRATGFTEAHFSFFIQH